MSHNVEWQNTTTNARPSQRNARTRGLSTNQELRHFFRGAAVRCPLCIPRVFFRGGNDEINERQLIDVTVVRRVRPRAEHNVRTYRFLPADTRYIREINERQLIYVTVVRRVRPRAEHNVRTYRFLPADTRYIRIWHIIRTWHHTKTKISRTHAQFFSPLKPRSFARTDFFFGDVAIRNSLRSNKSATSTTQMQEFGARKMRVLLRGPTST